MALKGWSSKDSQPTAHEGRWISVISINLTTEQSSEQAQASRCVSPMKPLNITNIINFHVISFCIGLYYFGTQVLSMYYFSSKCGEDIVSDTDSTWSGRGDRQLANNAVQKTDHTEPRLIH